MLSDELPLRPLDEGFLRAVAGRLDETFGLSFDLWLPGDPWRRLERSSGLPGDAPSARLREILEDIRQANSGPALRHCDECLVLAIPVARNRELVVAATTACAPASADLVLRLATAFVRELDLQEGLDRQRAANEAYAVEITRSFEELFLLRHLAEHLDLADAVTPSNSFAETAVPLLRDVIGAENLLWIGVRRKSDESACDPVADSELLASAGPGPVEPALWRSLIEQYRERAAIQPVVENHLQESAMGQRFPGVRELVMTSVATGDRHMGWLLAMNRCPSETIPPSVSDCRFSHLEFGTVEAGLVSTVASILATYTRNIELFREREEIFLGAVRALVNAIEAKDQYTRGHSERVGLLSKRLGQELGLNEATCQQLYLSGLLHDVGKIAIQDATLRKPGLLTDAEFEEIKQHPRWGWDILHDLGRLQYVLQAVVHHHEHYDGTGYLDGLAGEEIPQAARILAVADSYDALTSDRPYRQGIAQEKAEDILHRGAGTQWDPAVVAAMLHAMPHMVRICREYQPFRTPQRTPTRTARADRAVCPSSATAAVDALPVGSLDAAGTSV